MLLSGGSESSQQWSLRLWTQAVTAFLWLKDDEDDGDCSSRKEEIQKAVAESWGFSLVSEGNVLVINLDLLPNSWSERPCDAS